MRVIFVTMRAMCVIIMSMRPMIMIIVPMRHRRRRWRHANPHQYRRGEHADDADDDFSGPP